MARELHYVCDRCGHYFMREPASMMECPRDECQSDALWEFDRERPAREHAAHIERGIRSGIFRSR